MSRQNLKKEAEGLIKEAFWGVTPLKPNPEQEYNSFGNYARETINRWGGGIVGSMPGLGIGLGAMTALSSPKTRALTGPLATVGLGTAAAGGLLGNYRSLKKHEKEHSPDKKTTTPGQYAGRLVGDLAVSAVGVPILGDYITSRHLQDRKPNE